MAVGTKLAEEAVQPVDTEITLGTGKLLGIFFAAAALCALFFGLGFNLGRASAPQDLSLAAAAPASSGVSAAKPSPNHAATTSPCPAGQICSDSAAAETAPVQVAPEGTDPTAAPPATSTPAPAPATTPSPAATTPTTQPPATQPAQSTPATAPPATAGAATFVVQVAAVSRREDADALTIALRKKSYPAFVVSDLPDKLFHIQVGPFEDRKAALDMRDKLSSDGYNPIIK
ncbi:MAG TPA: SPOR domain-containing protein [Terriglobales bacterium]|nr:SPOR domain-containing protein [Terriglobales bacterium]